MGKAGTKPECGFAEAWQAATASFWKDASRGGLFLYFLTGFIAVFGIVIGHAFVKPADAGQARQGDLLGSLAACACQWYSRIVKEGYSYDPTRMSSVVFFPAYPLIGRGVVRLTGLRPC